jgi:hypothetical protein
VWDGFGQEIGGFRMEGNPPRESEAGGRTWKNQTGDQAWKKHRQTTTANDEEVPGAGDQDTSLHSAACIIDHESLSHPQPGTTMENLWRERHPRDNSSPFEDILLHSDRGSRRLFKDSES